MSLSPISEKWQRIAQEAREEAAKRPQGRARDAMLKRAQQLEAACEFNDWASCPERGYPLERDDLAK